MDNRKFKIYTMKKLLIIAIMLVGLVSCTKTKEEKMQENITNELLQIMDDPSTFQFVSMEINKTFTVGERKKVMNDERLKKAEELGMTGLVKQTKKEMEFLKYKDDNMEGVYYVRFTARGSNKFGAIIKATYSATVLNDDDRTVAHFKQMN